MDCGIQEFSVYLFCEGGQFVLFLWTEGGSSCGGTFAPSPRGCIRADVTARRGGLCFVYEIGDVIMIFMLRTDPHHSAFGCTYDREFILFEEAVVCAEYIVLYRRRCIRSDISSFSL